MADLTEVLKDEPTSVKAVDAWYEAAHEPRNWLGLSRAGHFCDRFLWYCHQGYIGKPPEGRVLRLFRLGKLLEEQVIIDLKSAGFEIHDQQKEVKFTQDDTELAGHIDGIIKGLLEAPATPHLFECKTCSAKKYNELLKKGYRAWNETYYWQTQFYMLALKLKRAAAFVYCKDDSRLCMERIKLDKQATMEKLQHILEVITGTVVPERSCPRVDYYLAKWCQFYEICWGLNKPRSSTLPW